MSEKHGNHETGPTPEDVRSAAKGWTVLTLMIAAVLGAAWFMAEV
jgi:hypothetical protein